MQNMAGIFDCGGNIVRNHNNGDTVPMVQFVDQTIHFRCHFGIKPGNRLVQEQHFLCGAQRTGKQYPLLLPVGQLSITPL